MSKKSANQLDGVFGEASPSEILAQLGVPHGSWDALIVGDGSGTGWSKPCGWASVLVDREGRRRRFRGAMDAGTSYLAEVIPYVQAIGWYADGPGKEKLKARLAASPLGRVSIHIVTDNEIVSKQGNGKARRKHGLSWWEMLDSFSEHGYDLHWHWLKRSRLPLNALCDFLAGMCRKSMDDLEAAPVPKGASIYDFNPSKGEEKDVAAEKQRPDHGPDGPA